MTRTMVGLVALLLLLLVMGDTTYTLHHRFLPLSGSGVPPKFVKRGVVSIDPSSTGTATFRSEPERQGGGSGGRGEDRGGGSAAGTRTEAGAGDGDGDRYGAGAGSGAGDGGGPGWYQLGLEVDGEWILGSTKCCCRDATGPTPQTLTLHLSSDHVPTALYLSPSSGDCSCATTSSCLAGLGANPGLDVVLKSPQRLAGPSLTPPPTVDPASGKPAPPEEKSFLQKYWIPLVGVGLFAATLLAPDPPAPAGAVGASGAGTEAKR